MKSWPSGKRQQRFSNVASDGVKPRPFAGGQDNGFHKRYLEPCAMDGATIMRKTTIGWVALATIFIAGCGGDVRADFPNPAVGVTGPEGNAGFETYVAAAKEMESAGEKYIGRTAWTPDQRDFIVQAARAPLSKIAALRDVKFGATWDKPFGARKSTRGWRTLGRALAWRIESAVKAGDNGQAIASMSTALKLANGLATSDAHDADMGIEIAEDCAEAIWPALPRFGAGELTSLANQIQVQLTATPSLDLAVEQERAMMYAQMGWVYQNYQKRSLEEITETLGQSVTPAAKYLAELAEDPADEQAAYFTNFKSEIDSDVEAYRQRLISSPTEWGPPPKEVTKPWIRFVRSFGAPWRVYVERRAEVRTRLKLLAIDAALLARFKASGDVPASLAPFSKALRTDPYSGRDFVFVSRGVDYKLYSVGPDKTDDGGDEGDLGIGR